jgi:putative membrane protein
MGAEVFKSEEMKLGDRLAVERTILAADRTLLASVRTSMSFIGFGFTIYKILQQLQKSGVATLVREQTPRNLGIFMILGGIVPLALSMFQYKRIVTRLGGRGVYVNPNMVTAGAILLVGVFLLVVVVANLNVI